MVEVLHSVAEALKGLLSWKSGKGFLLPFSPSIHLKESGAMQLLFSSPLDRIRSGSSRRERAFQLGLSISDKEPFEANQSFTCGQKTSKRGSENSITKMCTMDKFRGDALNTFSFSPGHSRGSFAKTPDSTSRSLSFSDSWTFFNMMSNGQVINGGIPANIYNPNKAVVTIDAKSSEILVANDMACRLFGYNSDELCKRRLADLFKHRRNQKTIVETHLETTGQLVLVSGKVVDVMDSDGDVIPVSLWVKKLDTGNESRCLAVMEPVERTNANFTFDSNGTILACDKTLATLYGYSSECEVEGLNVQTLIPSFILPNVSHRRHLPRNVKKQQATGRTRDGATFPLSVVIEVAPENEQTHFYCNDAFASTDFLLNRLISNKETSITSSTQCEPATSQTSRKLTGSFHLSDSTSDSGDCSVVSTPEDDLNDDVCVYTGVIWVFANISGMITILPDGTIHSCNHYFALTLLGYSQSQLVGKNISSLIPTFYDDLEFLENDSLQVPPYEESDFVQDELSGNDDCWRDNSIDHESIHEAYGPCSGLKEMTNSFRQLGILRSVEKEACLAQALNKFLQEKDDPSEKLWQMLSIESEKEKRIDVTNDLKEYNEHVVPDLNNRVCDVNGNNDREQSHILPLKLENLQLSDSAYSGSGDNTSYNLTHTKTDNKLASDGEMSPRFNKRHPKAVTNPPSVKPGSVVRSKSAICVGDGDTTDLGALQGTMSDEETPLGSCSSNTITDNSDKNIIPVENHVALASTPNHKSNNQLHSRCTSISEGSFFGLGRHRDGSDLSIIYQIKKVNLDDGQVLYCLWVSRDPEEPAEGGRAMASLTLASSVSSTLDASASSVSLGQIINDKCNSSESNQLIADHCDLEYVSGPYAEKYVTLQQIGKGAFGCVKMTYRKLDKLLVITKFIRKANVYDECWVDDNVLKKTVPLEVSLLTTLKHPNIVKVLDVFENADHFQMVMEKHGCGMDLFEFIDRGPNLDELLASYIFRQVVSAVGYLHSLNILHRDIKDENIILDERFHIKLIDFGSATFMAPGKLFSTFCGTVEYCSPEVLQGNKYRGPELEMWSLGVTLYTLIFGENPFFDVDETIKAVLRPPFQASKELFLLIGGLLNADPVQRFTLRELDGNEWLHQRVDIDSYRFDQVISCSAEEANPPRYYYEMSGLDQSFSKFNGESLDGNGDLSVDEEAQEA